MKTSASQRGVTLLEALVALLVMALGMLSFAALQARLRVNSDVAKQRSEAVRLAQEDMENMRAFGSLTADGTIANNFAYSGVVAGAAEKGALASSVVTTTNATYTITRFIDTSTVASMKDLRVQYVWKDRENNDQRVTLRSLIAGIDPKLAAALSIAPNGSPVKDPLGRDIQIPIPAKNLGDGTSVFKPVSSGGLAYVFNNDTGMITSKCTAVPSTTNTASITASDLAGYSCAAVEAFLLSGHVRFSYTSSTPDAVNPNDAPVGTVGIRLDLDDTLPPSGANGTTTQLLATSWPTLADAVDWSGYPQAPECQTEYNKTIRFTKPVNYSQVNNGVTQTATSTQVVAIVPAGTALTGAAVSPYVNVPAVDITNLVDSGERYVSYTCIVYPRLLGNVKSWTGRSLVVPTGWSIGTTTTTYKVCRYSEDYNLNGYVWTVTGSNVTKIENSEHPYAYLNATAGLNNQNFLVISGNKSCPTDGAVEVNGQGGENYTNETTVIHQS